MGGATLSAMMVAVVMGQRRNKKLAKLFLGARHFQPSFKIRLTISNSSAGMGIEFGHSYEIGNNDIFDKIAMRH